MKTFEAWLHPFSEGLIWATNYNLSFFFFAYWAPTPVFMSTPSPVPVPTDKITKWDKQKQRNAATGHVQGPKRDCFRVTSSATTITNCHVTCFASARHQQTITVENFSRKARLNLRKGESYFVILSHVISENGMFYLILLCGLFRRTGYLFFWFRIVRFRSCRS